MELTKKGTPYDANPKLDYKGNSCCCYRELESGNLTENLPFRWRDQIGNLPVKRLTVPQEWIVSHSPTLNVFLLN